MLSRHAEGLFWLGRYVERTADLTRMLDVAYNAQLERFVRSSDDVWRDLLKVFYLEDRFTEQHGDEITTSNINRFMVFDLDTPGSVARCARDARANVMNVRDVVPNELLESVNRLHTKLASGSLSSHLDAPHELYEAIAGECRAISGAVADSMSRHDEYRFLTLGRTLERAEMSCRMIDVNRRSTDVATWMAVLRSVSGFHAFIRAYGPLAPVDLVVTFLLREPSFPFSVRHCLERAGQQLFAVSDTGEWQSPRLLGRVTAALEFADVPALDSQQMEDMLESLENDIRKVSEALHRDLYQFGGDPALYSFEAL